LEFLEAAVMAFASVMDGPDSGTLEPLVSQEFFVLTAMLPDLNAAVRESTSLALCACHQIYS
jgi:hypothetical protein